MSYAALCLSPFRSDIQAFDIPSLQLMHQVWSQNTGCIFLTSCRNASITSMQHKAGNGNNGTHSRTHSEDGSALGDSGGSVAADNTTSQLWQYIQVPSVPQPIVA